ncbi:MAG TPA: PDDEXK nuclease domain-containing protein [Chitinophagaceae bacterium]|nr:PDDEXK nuclease domain-containing protein [Chitinophagaceae bacterium]
MKLEQSFIADIKEIISAARSRAYSAVNLAMIEAYWNIGKRIVEEEQNGQKRAEYGEFVIAELLRQLLHEFTRGFSQQNLRNFRQFYLRFPATSIHYAMRSELPNAAPLLLRKELTWTHYRLLMRVENTKAMMYYINEAADNNWSTRTLERNINTFYYERILSSQNKAGDITRSKDVEKQSPADFIKDPYIFEFLNIPEPSNISEHSIEGALIDNLQHFLLELGKGFSFIKRQYRINTETKSFSIDLVFYNYLLKCFVLFDLKTGELGHQDVGQMDMYVRIFDDLQRGKEDNPTIGIILCTYKDETIVKYSILNGSEQLFATKYRLYLPTEEELIKEVEREKFIIENKIKNQQ